MIDEGHLIQLKPAGAGDSDSGALWLVLRRLGDGDDAALLVAELTPGEPACDSLGYAIAPGHGDHAMTGAEGPAIVRFDALRAVTEADIAGSPGQLSQDHFANIRARWAALTFPSPPATGDFLPFALPDVGPREAASVLETLSSGWLTTGPKVARLEKEFAEAIGSAHALAVNSCTSGLHLALEAIGIGPADRVITTPNTFTASAEVIRYLGADPLFVDIDPDTHNLDPSAVAKALEQPNHGVKAILPVHFAGQACDMDPLLELARAHNLKIIEDAAHAFPASYKGRTIGTLGDITVFSFYATKTMTTGEGGMVVTDDADMARRMRLMRLHGIDRDIFDRYNSGKPAWYYEVVAPGFKYNMPDIAAAIGIEQLARADGMRDRREEIAEAYSAALTGLPLALPHVARPADTHAWHLYVIKLERDTEISRDRFIELMAQAGVGTSVHFIPLHLQPYWRDQYQLRPEDFPVALDVYQRSVSLPIYTSMTDSDVDRVIAAVRQVLDDPSQ